MEVKNTVLPNEEQIKGFFEPGAPGPIYMVNLLKFKPKAEYAEDNGKLSLLYSPLCLSALCGKFPLPQSSTINGSTAQGPGVFRFPNLPRIHHSYNRPAS